MYIYIYTSLQTHTHIHTQKHINTKIEPPRITKRPKKCALNVAFKFPSKEILI
jgi:hypothetical protein